MVNYITKVKQSRFSKKYLKSYQFNYKIIRKNATLKVSNEAFKDIRDIKFTKVQYGKMCYKDESMLFNKNVLIADQKHQKNLNWQARLVS